MPALQSQLELITLEQYEALPEDKRAEVFDGVIYDMARPSQIHQTILTELLVIIRNYIKSKNGSCSVFPAPFDVKLSDKPLTIVQPDIMVICDKDKLDGKRCNGAPDFIIEIVSPSSRRMDYYKKCALYAESGVREYWIVDPAKEKVVVYCYENDSDPCLYSFDADVPVGIYPGLTIRIRDLLN